MGDRHISTHMAAHLKRKLESLPFFLFMSPFILYYTNTRVTNIYKDLYSGQLLCSYSVKIDCKSKQQNICHTVGTLETFTNLS